jgi:hypothetical protein
MAKTKGNTKARLSEAQMEQIKMDAGDAASLIYSALRMARNVQQGHLDGDLAGLEALLEKAGFIADRCAQALGDCPFNGPWERWAGVEKQEAKEVAHGN